MSAHPAASTPAGTPDPDIRRLQAFAIHSLDQLDAQRKDIDRITHVVEQMQSEMSVFRDFIQETRERASVGASTTTSEAADILATNLSGIRRKANEVDELKLQLGMMKLRIKTLEDQTRTLKGATATTHSATTAPSGPAQRPLAASSTTPASVPLRRPRRVANKRLRSSLGNQGPSHHDDDDDRDGDVSMDPFNDSTPIDPQLLAGAGSSAQGAQHAATTPAIIAARLSRTNGSPATPSTGPKSSRSKRPVLTNERGERLRANGEVDRRGAWNRQYAAERRAAEARARLSRGGGEGTTPTAAGGAGRGTASGVAAGMGQLGPDEAEREKETRVRRERDRRVREAFEKEKTAEA